MKRNWQAAIVFMFSALLTVPALSALAKLSPDELAKESEDYIASTAKDKATPELVVEKVNKACELLEKEGKAAFSKFKGKGSEFLFAGTYIWVHDMNGVVRMHPIKVKMEGQPNINLKDANGKRLIGSLNEVVQQKGAGWVEYVWPKPGEKVPVAKVSYAKGCKIDGELMAVCCGIYDVPPAEVAQLIK